MDTRLQTIAALGALALAASAPADDRGTGQDFRLFFAVAGLSNPAITFSDAVNPARVNPVVPANGYPSPARIYLWAEHPVDDASCRALSLNVVTTGSAAVQDVVFYNVINNFTDTWEDTFPPAQFINGDALNANAVKSLPLSPGGLFSGAGQSTNGHVIGDVQLVGHVELTGVGEVFLEVGPNGIIHSNQNNMLPGPDVAFGFGDGPVSGSAYDTGSSIADAVLVCVGDLNGDLIVDTADLGLLIGTFGSAGPVGDINGDGAVDTADLGLLIGQFGTACGLVE